MITQRSGLRHVKDFSGCSWFMKVIWSLVYNPLTLKDLLTEIDDVVKMRRPGMNPSGRRVDSPCDRATLTQHLDCIGYGSTRLHERWVRERLS